MTFRILTCWAGLLGWCGLATSAAAALSRFPLAPVVSNLRKDNPDGRIQGETFTLIRGGDAVDAVARVVNKARRAGVRFMVRLRMEENQQ